MTTAEQRTARREAELTQALEGQRRLARPEDYLFDKSGEVFWDLMDGTSHSEKGVDASIPKELWRVEVEDCADADAEKGRGRPKKRKERRVRPSQDIMRVETNQLVEGVTWWPGRAPLIQDWFIDASGFFPAAGRRIYNQYKPPPPPAGGDAAGALRWVEHVKLLWPETAEHEHFFDYCAHMVQFPAVKCNSAIVLSGAQGIGKDVALLPIKAAVGAWNCKGVDPDEIFSTYKPWLQTLMLVVDEVRPTKDEFHASSMYNILKPMIAAPPDTLPLNDKYAKLRYVINVMRVFITTNDWMAMYIPPEDRRMFIMHSALPKAWHEAEGRPQYFVQLCAWMEAGGALNVAAWLRARDLSAFNPKAEALKTAGWAAVATSWAEPEDGVTLALEALGRPGVVFGSELASGQFDWADEMAGLLKSPRKMGHRMQKAGYVAVPAEAVPGVPRSERWRFRAEGRVFESRLVFVQQDLIKDRKTMLEKIDAHGKTIAARGSSVRLQVVGQG